VSGLRCRRVAAVLLAGVAVAGCGSGPERPAGPDALTPVSAPAGPARIVATEAVSARVRDLTIDSPALGTSVRVRLLLPPSYAAHPERRWPVLYLLHGCCDNYLSWTRSTDVEALTSRSDVLVVMPDGGAVGFYSDWRSGPAWERFHLGELPRLLEATYRAGTLRAVAGVSMGGLGALDYAARHRGMFAAAASFSGIVHTRLTSGESAAYQRLVRSQGGDPDRLWGDPVTAADLWRAHNPYDLAPSLAGAGLFVSVGSGAPGPLDPPGTSSDAIEQSLAAENAALADRLRELNIPAQIDFYGPGTHSWPYWQRELHRAWPLLEHALHLT
jgi:diacylglycerol O-acyltransferase / trehalose O-mycolyltransferase